MPRDPDHKVELKPHITLCPKYGIRMQIVNTKFFRLKELFNNTKSTCYWQSWIKYFPLNTFNCLSQRGVNEVRLG